jgi:hypothetical protein
MAEGLTRASQVVSATSSRRRVSEARLIWVLVSSLLLALGVVAVWQVASVLSLEDPPVQEPVAGDPSPLRPIQQPSGMESQPEEAPEEPAEPQEEAQVEAQVEARQEDPPKPQQPEPPEPPVQPARPEPRPDAREARTGGKESERQPSRSAKQGALTLVILPEAEVYRNGRLVGKTPMFNQPLPAGTHLLRIKGPDGKRRKLSVPIEAGKTTSFRLSLGEIPEG